MQNEQIMCLLVKILAYYWILVDKGDVCDWLISAANEKKIMCIYLLGQEQDSSQEALVSVYVHVLFPWLSTYG